MITINKLCKSYENRVILDKFSESIKKDEFVCISGESGSGKSTLIKILAGIEKADDGDITIMGHMNPSLKQMKEIQIRSINFIFQNFFLIDNRTVKENLMLVSNKHNRLENKNLVEALGMLNMQNININKKVYNFSGGEQQRIAIARALLVKKEIIVADEPTSSLDSTNSALVKDLFLEEKKKGVTVICVTHDNILLNFADRIINLEKL